MTVSPAKTAELIEMPFRMWTSVSQRHRVWSPVQIPTWEGAILRAKSDRPWTCLTVDIVNATQQGQNWYGADASWGVPHGYTLAPPGPMLWKHCLSYPDRVSVTLVYCGWPNGWMDQDETWHGGRPRLQPRVRWGPSSPKGAQLCPFFGGVESP